MERPALPLLVLLATPILLCGCLDDARTPADQAKAEHFRQLDSAGLSQLSGTQGRTARVMLPTADQDHPAGLGHPY